jgi:hypothetical protein
MIRVAIALLATVALVPMSSRQQAESLSADPIAAVGHGAAIDARGEMINITPSFIRDALDFYTRSLYERAPQSIRAKFDELRTTAMAGAELSPQTRLVVQSALLDWLIAEVRPDNASDLSSKNHFLRTVLGSQASPINQPFSHKSNKFSLSSPISQRMRRLGLFEITSPASATAASEAYIKECNDAGVPIPPDWGMPGWVSTGVLNDEFISASLEAEVFTYKSSSPEGTCIALPRSNGNSIKLLGVICLGKVSSKACFFDNQVDGQQVPVPKGTVKALSSFAGGPALDEGSGGICTSCHMGENPFILHPKTALGMPALRGLALRGQWYSPMVSSNWPSNPGPGGLDAPEGSAGDCQECHTAGGSGGRFPAFTSAGRNYCGILAKAIEKTMPPSTPGDPDYKVHADALLEACFTAP